jgi:hypothetical protein
MPQHNILPRLVSKLILDRFVRLRGVPPRDLANQVFVSRALSHCCNDWPSDGTFRPPFPDLWEIAQYYGRADPFPIQSSFFGIEICIVGLPSDDGILRLVFMCSEEGLRGARGSEDE